MTKQKIEMKRHLEKQKKCIILNDNNTLSDQELYKLSIIKNEQSIIKKEIIEEITEENNYCKKCNKYFYNKSNLKKHQKNICDVKNIAIQNIGVQNITNNNQINININYIKGFDEEWDTSMIDNTTKENILLCNTKFSKTLENILKNDSNLNVILNDDNVGMVYKNNKNKYEHMSKQDIIKISMEKVYKHLKDFYSEIINNNINDISEIALNNELKELEKKYSRFFRLEDAKNIVQNSFTSIYTLNKEKAENKYCESMKHNENDFICDIDANNDGDGDGEY